MVFIDTEHSVTHSNATLPSRDAAWADPADVDTRVKGDPMVTGVGPRAQVQHRLVSLARSPPPDHQRHGAGRAPQGGQHC